MTPLAFLDLLWQGKPEDLYILIWTRRDKTSHWFRDVGAAAQFVDGVFGADVYVGVGLASRDYGPRNRCVSDEIAGLPGLAADLDLKSEAHNKPLPATVEQALTILPTALPPTLIISTGNGVHVWWLFKEPWIFENDEERKQAAVLSSRFQTLLRYNANQHGWAFERLSDLARVLRIPGTVNAKDAANPKNVTVFAGTDHRYNPSDFERYLDEQAVPDQRAEAQTAKQCADRFTGQSLVIDLGAALPDERLETWMEEDRFSKTWNHQRTDMNDRSQSGYDQALAHFGVRSGLTDQEIVDLIIHNRRTHGAKQSQSLQYYRRTISKARNGTGDQNAAFDRSAAPGCETWRPPAPGRSPAQVTKMNSDPNAKAKLCEQISQILGVCILRIVQITAAEPFYLMELDGGCIEFPDTTKLLSRSFVKAALAGRAGKVIRTFTSKEWDQLTQMMIDACIHQEGTDDLDLKGQGRMYINQYLANHQILTSLEGQDKAALFYPVIDKGRIAISSPDLQVYVNKTTMQALSVKRFAAMIAALGGKSVRVRGQSFKEQSRWALPIEEWDPEEYATSAGETVDGQ